MIRGCASGRRNTHVSRYRTDYLEQIETPTLVFAAEKDGFTPPAVSETMAEKIPGAQLCVVPGASHSAPIEVPELFALRVEKFFLEHDLYTD